MMTIHAQQLAVFSQEAEARFEAQLVSALREHYPDAAAVPHGTFATFVRQQILKGESYGLSTQRQLATYVETAFLLGASFDERFTMMGRVLRTKETDPDRKAQFLEDHTRELFTILRGGR